jgi:hypothetical protein
MSVRSRRLPGILLALLLPLACTRLPKFAPEAEGGTPTDALKDSTSVPPEWGTLVSVTSMTTPDNSVQYFQLWFQDKDGTVRVVSYDPRTNHLMPKAGRFQRR